MDGKRLGNVVYDMETNDEKYTAKTLCPSEPLIVKTTPKYVNLLTLSTSL